MDPDFMLQFRRHGRLRIEGVGVLSPRMTREKFEADISEAELFDETLYHPSASYGLGSRMLGGRRFGIQVVFEHGTLRQIVLTDDEQFAGRGWEGFTPELAARSKAQNDAWVSELAGGPDARFAWGGISSLIDAKTAIAEVVILFS